MNSEVGQASPSKFNFNTHLGMNRDEFDSWAKAVKAQMLECLNRRKSNADSLISK
jgi:hypothetical protein